MFYSNFYSKRRSMIFHENQKQINFHLLLNNYFFIEISIEMSKNAEILNKYGSRFKCDISNFDRIRPKWELLLLIFTFFFFLSSWIFFKSYTVSSDLQFWHKIIYVMCHIIGYMDTLVVNLCDIDRHSTPRNSSVIKIYFRYTSRSGTWP